MLFGYCLPWLDISAGQGILVIGICLVLGVWLLVISSWTYYMQEAKSE